MDWYWPAVVANSCSLLVSIAVGVGAARRGGLDPGRPWPLGRGFLYAAAAAWLVYLVFFQPFHQIACEVYLGAVAGVYPLAVWLARRRCARPPRWLWTADLLLWNLVLAAILLELTLRGLALVHASPLFLPAEASILDRIEAFRFPPGTIRFGFPFNEEGYYDESFAAARPAARRIVVVADSFGVGVVPHELNFTTRCERMTGWRFDNLSVAGVGPDEYEYLLSVEGRRLDPDAFVVCLFLGNDIEETRPPRRRSRWLRRWFSRDEFRLYLVGRRFAAVLRHQVESPPGSKLMRGDPPNVDPSLPIAERYPWLADPRLEPALLSENAFLSLEVKNATFVCAPPEDRYEPFFHRVSRIAVAAGETPTLFVLIPDEFQVNDELWAEIVARAPTTVLDRDQPQRLIGEWMRRRGLWHLDLLPAFRAEPTLADGSGRLYHLRDSHWNARGNEVAAREIVGELSPRLEEPLRRR